MFKFKFPRLTYNKLSIIGAYFALIIGFAIVILISVALLYQEEVNPYFMIVSYIVLPAALVFSLLLIPLGMFFEWRRWRRGERPVKVKWPIIDFNRSSHRNATILFIMGTILIVLGGSFGTYQAYHFSESVQFCGTTCHTVMKPQYTAYKSSPHARVPCTSCHVGSGANWYVKSKLSGAYQVYAVLFNKYPRPIPTPIKNLRPAQETCEECHWREKSYGSRQREFNHYMYDDENTPVLWDMIIKTGGGDPLLNQTAGIHWHMNVGADIEYIARDFERQDIPWVKVTEKRTGRVTIYEDEENPLTPQESDTLPRRKMDCLDCHNRPSHAFFSPDHAVDEAIHMGKINRNLPAIKRIAVEALAAEYEDTETALKEIANTITTFYKNEHPEIFDSLLPDIEKAVLTVQDAFKRNMFPEMKARWSEYPINLGHFTNKGCMRCHEGRHKSKDGLQVTHQCNACHVILSQSVGEEKEVAATSEGLEFKHPEDIDEAWREMGCYECHDGTQP